MGTWIIALLGGSAPALAQDGGYSVDIEFVRPNFGHEGFAGVDVPRVGRHLTVRAGTVVQYQQAPLTLVQAVDNTPLGAVIANRFSAMVGASLDVERMTFGVMVPTAYNWGTEQVGFAADGFGVGDVGANVRVTAVRTRQDAFNVGFRGGILLPTGKRNSYLGESRVRFTAGGLVAARLGPVTVASDVGLMSRREVETPADFTAGTEFTWGNAVRLALPQAMRMSVNAQLLARSRAQAFLQGGANTSFEGLVGLDVYPDKRTTVGVAAGRGFTEGYGTTDFRLLGNLTVSLQRPGEPPEEWEPHDPDGPDVREPTVAPPPPDVDEPTDRDDHIQLPEQLRFYVNTDELRPESVPILDDIAELINTTASIGMVIVEGHASQEGNTRHNYALADSRARRIWELLLERGVAFERIAYRHRGETAPVERDGKGPDPSSEEGLRLNRRVEFLIVNRHAPGTEPTYPSTQFLPWNGRTVEVVTPQPPEPEDEFEEFDELD